MKRTNQISRRDCLRSLASAMSYGVGAGAAHAQTTFNGSIAVKPKSVAVIGTMFRELSHVDVLAGKILEGWDQDGGAGPALRLASLYIDQFPDADLARSMAKKYDVPLFDTIEAAVTGGGDRISVDGVISIGEHGDYPVNDKGQKLHPRRRFFQEITDAFKKYDRVVPVFSDKHLGPTWTDAKWMYDRAREMNVPFMAGSSLPVSFRKPDVTVPMGCEIEAALGIGYSGLDIYGSHTLDCFQCLVERRRNAEAGVRWVQCLQGDAIWEAVDDGVVREDLLVAALEVTPHEENADMRKTDGSSLFLFEYVDGLMGTVLMLPGFSGGISAALKIKGKTRPLATYFEERPKPKYPHFAYLLKGIERMIHSGRPSYPVERVLLTSGILDRALTSIAQDHEKLITPELTIAYQPVAYPHAPLPDLGSDPLLLP